MATTTGSTNSATNRSGGGDGGGFATKSPEDKKQVPSPLVYKMVSKPRPPLCVCRYYVCIYYSSLSKDNCLGLTIRMYPIF